MRRKKAAAKTLPPDTAVKPQSLRPTSAPRSEYRLAPWLISIGLIAGVFMAFGSACSKDAEFLRLDDGDYIINNPHVRSGLSIANIQWAFTTFEAANWHPLTWLSMQLDSEMYGLQAWGFHLTNVLWHAVNAVLFFVVLERMTGALWCSAFAAALFAVHPLRVESVAWATERKDVLSSFFWLLTMLAYWWYVQRPAIGRYILVVVCFALGLMAKQMVVTLPFVLLLLDYWPLGRFRAAPERRASLTRIVLEKLPLLAMAVGAGVMTLLAQVIEQEPLLRHPPLQTRILNACLAYTGYLRKTLWPADLAPLYTRPLDRFPVTEAMLSGVILIVLTFLILRQYKRRPYLAVGWLWYLGTLVPVIGLVQVGIQTMADRYTYVPHMGLFIALVWGLADLLAPRCPKPILAVGAGVILLACNVVSQNQTRLWQRNLTLWEYAVQVTEDNFGAHQNLGVVYKAMNRDEDALRQFRKAIELEPGNVMSHYVLGMVLESQKKWSAAAESFAEANRIAPGFIKATVELADCYIKEGRMEEALEPVRLIAQREPDSPEAHYNLALALLYREQYAEAVREASEALRLNPGLHEAHKLLGYTLAVQGKMKDAEEQLRQALWLPPQRLQLDTKTAYFLAWSLHAQGRDAEAQDQYQAADKNFADPRKKAEFLGKIRSEAWRLSTHPDAKRRNGSLALLQAQVVNKALEETDAEALDTLAAAYAEVGKFDEAIAAARKAVALANANQKGPVEQRLKLYEQRQAFRTR